MARSGGGVNVLDDASPQAICKKEACVIRPIAMACTMLWDYRTCGLGRLARYLPAYLHTQVAHTATNAFNDID